MGPDGLFTPFLLSFMALAFIGCFSKHDKSIANIAITTFGLVYITLPLSFLIDINFIDGSIWLVFLLIITKISDTFAYTAGKLCGNHLLAPLLSPKKTIEGALAGLLGSILTSVIFFGCFSSAGA